MNEGIEVMEQDKKIGIMQPYLFPYVGYFSLINYVDEFIFFDSPQYIRKGWINRNRILRADGNPDFFTVPIQKCARETAIKDVMIDNSIKWKEKIMGQLTVYKRRAPYYERVLDLIKDVFLDSESISELAIKSVITTMEYIGIETEVDIFSKMKIQISDVNDSDEWALNITKAMGYKTYVNPPGGMLFFDKEKYKKANIELQFLEATLNPYNQRIGKFEAGLSILDMMMFLKPDEIREMLQCYTIQ